MTAYRAFWTGYPPGAGSITYLGDACIKATTRQIKIKSFVVSGAQTNVGATSSVSVYSGFNVTGGTTAPAIPMRFGIAPPTTAVIKVATSSVSGTATLYNSYLYDSGVTLTPNSPNYGDFVLGLGCALRYTRSAVGNNNGPYWVEIFYEELPLALTG